MQQQPRRTAAFFDVDRTIFPGSSLLALAGPLRRAGIVNTRTMGTSLVRQAVFSRRGSSDLQVVTGANLVASLMRGIDANALALMAHDLVPRHIEPRIFPSALALIEDHRSRGDLIILISSAPKEIVAPLAAVLGADDFACTVAHIHNGLYTGAIATLMHGHEKGKALQEIAQRHNLDLAGSSAYGDAGSDVHMLELVGTPVCVNGDKRLSATAVQRGWIQLTFVRPKKRLQRATARLDHHASRFISKIRDRTDRTLQ